MADTDSPEEYESSNESSVEEEELEEEQQHRDGLADMMSKILNQKVGDKIPVLSKRKTPMMKEIEGETEEIEKLKRQRIDKKAEKEKQLVVPDASTADFERQLKRLATRGG